MRITLIIGLVLLAVTSDPCTEASISDGPVCRYALETQQSEYAVGLQPGDLAWFSYFEAAPGCTHIRCMQIEFGIVDPKDPNTTPARLFVYDDPTNDNDPSDAVMLWSDTTSFRVQGEGEWVITDFPIGPVDVDGGFFVCVAVDGFSPAVIDAETLPGFATWVAWDFSNPDDPLDDPGVVGRLNDVNPTLDGTWIIRVTGEPADCSGDTNGDFVVGVDDVNNVILDWGTDGSANGGDLTGSLPGSPPDGIVNVNDLNAVIVGWGACP